MLVAKIRVEVALELHYLYIYLYMNTTKNLIFIHVFQYYPVHSFKQTLMPPCMFIPSSTTELQNSLV
jgi:hypothetical protein